MPNLVVIQIIPQQAPIDPGKFTTDYLNPAGLGPLQVTAFNLSFNSPTMGQTQHRGPAPQSKVGQPGPYENSAFGR